MGGAATTGAIRMTMTGATAIAGGRVVCRETEVARPSRMDAVADPTPSLAMQAQPLR